MNDTITLQDIQVTCILGCYAEERNTPRPVSISLLLETDIATPGKSDCLQDALDYDTLTQSVIDLAQHSAFNLVEALAEAIAACCLKNERVKKVTVAVTKPHPRPQLKAAIITITREKA